MIELRNTPKDLLQLGFTGYALSGREEVFDWIEQTFNADDYYLRKDNIVFLRNPSAETLLFLKHDKEILTAYRMQRNRKIKHIK